MNHPIAHFVSLALLVSINAAIADQGPPKPRLYEALQIGATSGMSALSTQPPVFAGPLGEVRVLVFPHWGKFTIPQGKETSISSVHLISTERCEVRPIDAPEAEPTLQKDMRFSVDAIGSGRFIKCAGTTQIERGSLKSYSYSGNFSVMPWVFSGRRGIAIVNHVPFNDYIQGVIPYEMPATWGLEPLKAQAVAARTYAYYEIAAARAQVARNEPWDLDDTVQYQAYGGVSDIKPDTREAVNATDGELMIHDSHIVKAYFHSDSGGHLESPVEVWGGDPLPYCKSKPEVFDPALVASDWKLTLLGSEITTRLRAAGWTKTRVATSKVTILSRNMSGRATRVRVHFGGRTLDMPATEFRYALKLRSTLFDVSAGGASLTFTGRGHGHGVGMNQHGARALIQGLGWTYRQVLEFYYDGAEIGG